MRESGHQGTLQESQGRTHQRIYRYVQKSNHFPSVLFSCRSHLFSIFKGSTRHTIARTTQSWWWRQCPDPCRIASKTSSTSWPQTTLSRRRSKRTTPSGTATTKRQVVFRNFLGEKKTNSPDINLPPFVYRQRNETCWSCPWLILIATALDRSYATLLPLSSRRYHRFFLASFVGSVGRFAPSLFAQSLRHIPSLSFDNWCCWGSSLKFLRTIYYTIFGNVIFTAAL